MLHILDDIQDLPQFLIHKAHLLLLGTIHDEDSLGHFLEKLLGLTFIRSRSINLHGYDLDYVHCF